MEGWRVAVQPNSDQIALKAVCTHSEASGNTAKCLQDEWLNILRTASFRIIIRTAYKDDNMRPIRITKKYMTAIEALYGVEAITRKVGIKSKRSLPDEPPIKPQRVSEDEIQIRLMKWAREQGLPLISIPNAGKRTPWSGRRERAKGLTVGVSDLFLAMPCRGFHGMWIELKSQGRKPSKEQYLWLQQMLQRGYHAVWFDDLEEARAAIAAYVGI